MKLRVIKKDEVWVVFNADGLTYMRPEDLRKAVDLSFVGDRNQLFAAWNAIANLADMAGTVSVNVRAEAEEGFDQGKLRNGVIEPLREADLIE